jgi:DNA-binding GntR family transcriptional regulator
MRDRTKHYKQALYDHLKVSVLTLALRPGDDIDEAVFAETFGLSRTPLREVLRELAGEGYLELRAGRGARVTEMSYTTLRDFFLAAPMIYGAILRLAAQNATAEQIKSLKAAQSKFKKSLRSGSAADRTLANNQFHEITGEMAGNIFLLAAFNRLLIDHARIGITFYRPQNSQMADNLSAASSHHDDIISAIETQNDDAAAQLAEAHWNLSRNQIELFVMPSALDIALGTAFQQTSA